MNRGIRSEHASAPPDRASEAPNARRCVPLWQRLFNFVTFPIRAAMVLQRDVMGLMALRTERFSYVSEETVGCTLDIGCGPWNRFVSNWITDGTGIDVYRYDGLNEDQIVSDMTHLPYGDGSFDSVSLIAALNHIPRPLRRMQLAEMHRVLRPGGRLIITMGSEWAEAAVHRLVHFYSERFRTHEDMDNERGMEEDEEYSVKEREILDLLAAAGFTAIRTRRLWTQWGLNKLYVASR